MTHRGKAITARSCTGGACVQVWRSKEVAKISDSKQNGTTGATELVVTTRVFEWFQQELRGSRLLGSNGILTIERQTNGWFRLADARGHDSLSFDEMEWTAFCLGVRSGDFGLDRFLEMAS